MTIHVSVSIYFCHIAELGQMNQIVFMNENNVLPKAEGYVIKSKNEEISKKR